MYRHVWSGATNLITGLADALLDSIPVVAITGQVSAPFIGTDAFQEVDVPIVVSLYQAQLSGAVAGRVAAHHG